MSFFIVIFLILCLIAFISIVSQKSSVKGLDSLYRVNPYKSKNPLTKTETLFYHTLVKALPNYIVLAQVQLSRFIEVDRSLIDLNEFYKFFNPISQQSVDYLICTDDFEIVTAIELDDKTHLSSKANERDNKKNASLEAAKISLIRWHVENLPDFKTITSTVHSLKPNVQNVNNSPLDYSLVLAEDEFLSGPQFKSSTNTPFAAFVGVVIGLVVVGFFAINAYSFLTQSFNSLNRKSSAQVINKEIRPRIDQLKVPATKLPVVEQKTNGRNIVLDENEIKEGVWNKHFKNKTECVVDDLNIYCGVNEELNRKNFEKYWEESNNR